MIDNSFCHKKREPLTRTAFHEPGRCASAALAVMKFIDFAPTNPSDLTVSDWLREAARHTRDGYARRLKVSKALTQLVLPTRG